MNLIKKVVQPRFISELLFAIVVMALALWPTLLQAQSDLPPGSVIFDFNTNNGQPLSRGEIVSTITVDDLTMTVDVDSNGSNNVGMIFDTNDPGPDPDLGTPNENCPGGGPGIGEGGEPGTIGENCDALGNVLIIPRDVGPNVEPNDDNRGGVVSLTFDQPVRVVEIHILDIDEEGTAPLITFWDSDGNPTLEELRPQVVGNNGHEEFTSFPANGAASVATIQVTFPGSGALDSIIVAPAEPVGAIDIVKLINGADANDPAGTDVPRFAPGEPVAWTYQVTNIGEIAYPRADVVVTDSDPDVTPLYDGEILGNGDDVLDPGEMWAYLAVREALDLSNPAGSPSILAEICPADDGTLPLENGYMNIGTVTVPDAEATDPAHYCPKDPGIAMRKFVNGADANDPLGADVPRLAPGESVTWTYRVTNTGEIPYPAADVVVADSDPTVEPVFNQVLQGNDNDTLEPGEVWEYIAESEALNLSLVGGNPSVGPDICRPSGSIEPPTQNGYMNIGTVTVPDAVSTDPAHYCPKDPGIAIRKFVNGADANDPLGADVPRLAPGESVIWTYRVTNTGQIEYPIADVVVTDSDPGVVPVFHQVLSGNDDNILAPGEVWEYQAESQALNLFDSEGNLSIVAAQCRPEGSTEPPAQNGYKNIGTVTVPDATAADPAHYCSKEPGLQIRKFVNGADANDPAGTDVPRLVPGEAITWTYRVTNTGELPYPMSAIEVTDNDPDVTPEFDRVLSGNDDDTLDPGEVWQYVSSRVALDLRDMDDSPLVIRNGCPGLASEQEDQNAYRNIGTVAAPGSGGQDGAIYCNILPDLDAGRVEQFELSYTILNDGPVAVLNVQVFAGPNVSVTCPATVLAPSESMICQAVATDIGFRNSIGWVVAEPVGGGVPLIRTVVPDSNVSIETVVLVNGDAADSPSGPVVALEAAKNTADLAITVTNTGSAGLEQLQVGMGDQDLTCAETTLAAGQSTICALTINVSRGPQVLLGGISAQAAGLDETLMQQVRVYVIGE